MTKYLALLLLVSSPSFSSVWETTNDWSSEWEQKYQNWIQSEEYNEKIFKNKNSKWYGTRTDCADAVFAARIIFSSLNGLPFKLYNPSGARRGSEYAFIHNEISAFDNYQEGAKRVIKFIEYIGDSVGTDNLARHATYPVQIELIGSGDAYVYHGGSFNHAYMIKERLLTGNFRLFWSTTPKAARKLSSKVGLPGHGFENRPWGYKRFKWPEFVGRSNNEIPTSFGYSNEMYRVAEKAGTSGSLRAIRKIMKKIDENPQDMFTRESKNICNLLDDRKSIIEETTEFLREKDGRCMNLSEYDDYSTPSRDLKIYNAIDGIRALWEDMRDNGRTNEVSEELRLALDALTGNDESSGFWPWSRRNREPTPGSRALEKLCTIEIPNSSTSIKINFLNFYKLYRKGKISHHPNDPIARRWGVKVKKTRCKKYY